MKGCPADCFPHGSMKMFVGVKNILVMFRFVVYKHPNKCLFVVSLIYPCLNILVSRSVQKPRWFS